jgi:hypothetical protein
VLPLRGDSLRSAAKPFLSLHPSFVDVLVFTGEYSPNRSGCSASGDEVDNQYHDGDDQQKVDQTACYMETEPEQPQNQEDDEDCPKHGYSLGLFEDVRACGSAVSRQD